MDGDPRAATVDTTCPYCGVGCGVRVSVDADGVKVGGDPAHPANRGRLCVKGSALGETLGLEGRLLHPQQRVDGAFQERDWDGALDAVARGFAQTVAEHGPDSVALYVSGQLLTEDYYVANKLMKGYLGSANIDTNSRLCMASAVAGYKRAFGEDVVPVSYDDVEQADLVVLVGSNLAWCHPVLYQRLAAAKAARPEMKVVVIDPRHTATCALADLHLPLASGSDVMLFAGLLVYLEEHGVVDAGFLSDHTLGASGALRVARGAAPNVAGVAAACDLPVERLGEFYRLFAGTERVVTLFSQGVNQSSSGTDKVNAIINCHLLSGRIGRPGMGPFSITGQPNAMGGREVGGLANQLAAHLDLENAGHRALVQGFWNSPLIAERPGLKAVELFDAVHDGRIKALWIIATNPVVSLPQADRVKEALQRCPLVVVSDVIADTETTRLAHWRLPAAAWGEKEGTVTNSERVISRQRAFRAAPGEARPDWWMLAQVGRRLGHEAAFDYPDARAVFVEHAALAGLAARQARRAFDIGALAELDAAGYAAMTPLRWPTSAGQPCTGGTFYHADGRAHFVATSPRAPLHATDEAHPLVLNTGRVRDQWHSMTRTGLAPTLAQHTAEPFVDLHAADALTAGLRAGEIARVSSNWGCFLARVTSSGAQRRGQAFAPIHWSEPQALAARVGAVVNPVVDPVSGEPEFKHTPVRVEPYPVSGYGYLLLPEMPDCEDFAWWARVRLAGGWRVEFAHRERFADAAAWLRERLGVPDRADTLEYVDQAGGVSRLAWLEDGVLRGFACLSPRPDLPPREWLSSRLGAEPLDAAQRATVLAGRPPVAGADPGPTVCACFGVGRLQILRAIRRQGLTTPEQITRVLKAGGNCGSCVPELRALLAEQAASEVAA